MNKFVKSARKTVINILIIYVLLLVLMFLLQGKLLFHPTSDTGSPSEYLLADFEIVKIKTADNLNLTGWFHKGDKDKAVLYFYGNADTLANYPEFFRKLSEQGYTVLGVNYRGYGGSEGKPSEKGLYQDAEAALKFLGNHVSAKNTIVIGRSLGTGVAVEAATHRKLKGLVLLSPYTSIPDVASEIYWYLPVKYLARHRFSSIDKIARINDPVLIIHGDIDTLIPLAHAEKLYKAAKGKKELKVYGNTGHNDIDMLRVARDMQEFFGKEK